MKPSTNEEKRLLWTIGKVFAGVAAAIMVAVLCMGAAGTSPSNFLQIFGTNTSFGYFGRVSFSNANLRSSGGILYVTPLGSGGGGGTGSFSFAPSQFSVTSSTNVTLVAGVLVTNPVVRANATTDRSLDVAPVVGQTNDALRIQRTNSALQPLLASRPNSGRIGINTNAPSYTLDVVGDAYIHGPANVSGAFQADGTATFLATLLGRDAFFGSSAELEFNSSGNTFGPNATYTGNLTANEGRFGTNVWFANQLSRAYGGTNEFRLAWTNGDIFLVYRRDIRRIAFGALTYSYPSDTTTNASDFYVEDIYARTHIGYDIGSLANMWRTGYFSAVSTTNITAETLNLSGSVSPSHTMGGGSTNYQHKLGNSSVMITNLLGLRHVSASTPLAIDANSAHNWSITNRISAATTLVITNTADGQDIQIRILGEISGGTSRVVTIVPELGHLVVNEDVFGTALATSATFTLTNGNMAEVWLACRKLNGTNTLGVVHRQASF